MSDIAITVQTVTSVEAHPDADRLEVVKILGTQCVVPKGEYLPGQRVLYFPPDMMIPEEEADRLGVKKYLKHVRWNGKKVQSRISACRIRGITSYGFPAPCQDRYKDGFDVTWLFDAEKYEPPAVLCGGVPGGKGSNPYALEEGNFLRYTDIQNFYRYPNIFDAEEKVVVTEKIHGTNSRVGVMFEDNDWVYAAGSHKVRWMETDQANRYWKPLRNHGMLSLLAELCDDTLEDIIVYGEIFGSKVQDLDYGAEGDEGYRVFDIRVNGTYLDWPEVVSLCQQHDLLTVPVIYEGPWGCMSHVIDEYAAGQTSVGTPVRKFKGREGIVIKPVEERFTRMIDGEMSGGRRAILKYISADYIDRKGAQDNG
jgi:RNA ligase (TIGR02306 family)